MGIVKMPQNKGLLNIANGKCLLIRCISCNCLMLNGILNIQKNQIIRSFFFPN